MVQDFDAQYINMKSLWKKKLTEKSWECHNHKPQPIPDTKRMRKWTEINTWKTNKQMHKKNIDHLSLPQARWSQC